MKLTMMAVAAILTAAPCVASEPLSNGNADADYRLHLEFDAKSAKGEILCKDGKSDGLSIKYENCAKNNINKYDEVAISKKIVENRSKYDRLNANQQNIAKRLAFLDSARNKLLDQMSADQALNNQSKRMLAGAFMNIDTEFNHWIDACEQRADKDIKCPRRPGGQKTHAAGASGK